MTKSLKLESHNKILKKRNYILERENRKLEKYLKSLNRQLLKEYHQVKEKLDLSQEVIKNLTSENERLKVSNDPNTTNHASINPSTNLNQDADNKQKSCDLHLKKVKKDQWVVNKTKLDQDIRNQNARIQSLSQSLQQKDEIIRLLKNRIEKKNEISFKITEKFKTLLNKIS